MIKFETINDQLCLMLEKPIPLTEDAKFPCVVRLIQDDSPMGKMNKGQVDYYYGVALRLCLRPVLVKSINDRSQFDTIWEYHRYELLGYPVADHSVEWALYRMQQGDMVCQKDSDFKRYYKNGNVCWLDRAGKERSLTIDLFLKNFANTIDWQIYIEQPKPEHPAINGYNRYDYVPVEGIKQPKPEPMLRAKPRCGLWIASTADAIDNGNYRKAFLEKNMKPKPAPLAVQVGDWVRTAKGDGKVIEIPLTMPEVMLTNRQRGSFHADEISVISPVEVVVDFGSFRGTIELNSHPFRKQITVKNTQGDAIAYINIVYLDTPTRELVQELIEKQGENNG